MTYIPVNFNDAVESKPASAGRYRLQITACEVAKTGQNSKRPGSPQFRVTVGFEDQPNTPNITQYISLPHEDDDASSARYKTLLLKRFLVLFGVPFSNDGIDTEEMCMAMPGHGATAEVTLTEPDENGNVYNRLVVPRLKSE